MDILGDMNEEIIAVIVGSDEAVAAGTTEVLDFPAMNRRLQDPLTSFNDQEEKGGKIRIFRL
jgi:hypothetical protein